MERRSCSLQKAATLDENVSAADGDRGTGRNAYRDRTMLRQLACLGVSMIPMRRSTLLPAVPGGEDDGKGVGRRHPGGLDRRGVDAPGRRDRAEPRVLGLSGISKSQDLWASRKSTRACRSARLAVEALRPASNAPAPPPMSWVGLREATTVR